MTEKKNIQLIGCGGHSRVVLDALIQSGYDHIFVFDDDYKNNKALDAKPLDALDMNFPSIVSIGANHVRSKIVERFPNLNWTNAIHPSAIIHPTSRIGKGVYIGANSVVQPYVMIGDHTIINTGSIVEHDAEIGNYCHIAPGNILAGGVRVGDFSFLGAGTTVIPNICIGDNVIIGAGSVVIRNTPSSVKAVGCPSKIISTLI